MTLVDHAPPVAIVEYLPLGGSQTAVGQLAAMYQREVLPHFFAPSSRQLVLGDALPHAQASFEEPELDSPPFTPEGLAAFAAGGFVRKNRWSSGR